MPTATRTNPLSFLTDQLDELKAKGTHFKLRVLEDESRFLTSLHRSQKPSPCDFLDCPPFNEIQCISSGGSRGDYRNGACSSR